MGDISEDQMKKLTKAINKSNNLWWAFFRGIFYGFGFFVGSAVLAAVLIYLFSGLKSWSFVGDAIEKILDIVSKT